MGDLSEEQVLDRPLARVSSHDMLRLVTLMVLVAVGKTLIGKFIR